METPTNFEAINKFMLFSQNYGLGQIEKMLNESTNCGQHLYNKYLLRCEQNNNNGSKGFLDFYFDMSHDNIKSCIEWINANYKG